MAALAGMLLQAVKQWGYKAGVTSITFPLSCSACYSVTASGSTFDSTRPADTGGVRIASISGKGFTIYKHRLGDEQYNSGNANNAFTGYWLAYCKA